MHNLGISIDSCSMILTWKSQNQKVDCHLWQITPSFNAEIAEAAKGHRESYLILVDNLDYDGTFRVHSLRNDLWCVRCVVVVDRIPSTVSPIQRDCHSLENLCNCVIVPAVMAFFGRNSHISLCFFQFVHTYKDS